MELNFNKEGNVWVAEFEATSDFNLHLERSDDGLIKVMQRGTTEGEYVDSFITSGDNQMKNFDCDFAALVYPKYIKVISGTEVITAYVNFNEGGGSGSGSDSNNTVGVEYYSITSDEDILAEYENPWEMITEILQQCNYIKIINRVQGGSIRILNSQGINIDAFYAISPIGIMACNTMFFDNDGNMYNEGSWKINILKYLESNGYYSSYRDFFDKIFTPITKEEFYNLDNLDIDNIPEQ